MKVISKTKQQNYFGRYQKAIALATFTILQLALYVPVAALLYGLIFVDLNVLGVLAAITILQLPVRRSQTVIDLVNKFIQPMKYFQNFEVIFQEEIVKQDRCMFGVHPHSVIALSLLALMNIVNTGPISNLIGLSSRFALNFPITGLVLKLWGIEAVNHKNLGGLMKKGKNIGLLPGGFEEATVTTPKEFRCWLNDRKGFIKYALRYGYTIYPVIMTNQHKAFWTFEPMLNFRLMLNKLKIPAVLFWNKWTGVFLPPSLEMSIVVGRGIYIQVGKGEGVTNEMVDNAHKAYISEIERLYKKYSHLNGNVPLVIL